MEVNRIEQPEVINFIIQAGDRRPTPRDTEMQTGLDSEIRSKLLSERLMLFTPRRFVTMQLRVVVVALLLTLAVFSNVYANTSSAEDVVRSTSESVIQVLNTQKEDLEQHPEHLHDLIHELVVPHFDFPIMSRWVLGKVWNKTGEDQQQAFITQFKTLLVRTYAKALMEYSDEKISFLPVDNDPNSNLVVVKTLVTGDGSSDATPMNYRMHISGGDWKVIDISVDGVSLIGTYRGSFGSEIRKNGIDSLIQKLTERNERLNSEAVRNI